MKLEQIISELGMTLLNPGVDLNREVRHGYASDLLSDVMAEAVEGDIWITIQSHVNVVAVASLKELSAVVLSRNMKPVAQVLDKATEVGLPVLGTSENTFDIAGKLYQLFLNNEYF